jgi:hypothetical protein
VWNIVPGLYLGDRTDASDRERLRKHGITHIVNCSKELPCHFPREFAYLWLKMDDPDPQFGAMIPRFCQFIAEGRQRGKVMIHCTGAVSRSPAVVLAYLCEVEGGLEQAVIRLSSVVATGIDEDFLYQLAQSHGITMTPASMKALQQQLMGQPGRSAAGSPDS